jgi:hypothetical protein
MAYTDEQLIQLENKVKADKIPPIQAAKELGFDRLAVNDLREKMGAESFRAMIATIRQVGGRMIPHLRCINFLDRLPAWHVACILKEINDKEPLEEKVMTIMKERYGFINSPEDSKSIIEGMKKDPFSKLLTNEQKMSAIAELANKGQISESTAEEVITRLGGTPSDYDMSKAKNEIQDISRTIKMLKLRGRNRRVGNENVSAISLKRASERLGVCERCDNVMRKGRKFSWCEATGWEDKPHRDQALQGCACWLAKTARTDSTCPEGKWKAVDDANVEEPKGNSVS